MVYSFGKFFTMQEVASILRINRSSVSRLCKSLEIVYIEVGGRKLIAEHDLESFIENRRVTSDKNAVSTGE